MFGVIVLFELFRAALARSSSEGRGGPGRGRRDVRRLLALTGSFGAIYLPYFLWRLTYYGFPLPNTFYTKVGPHLRQALRGLRYGMGFTTVAALILAPIFVWLLSRRKLGEFTGARFLVVLIVVYSAYIVAVGGDGLAAYRFFAPILPLLCLASAMSALRFMDRRSLAAFAAAVALYNVVQMSVGYGIHLHLANDRVAEEGREVGLWLREHAPADAVIAVNAAGAVPYFSRLRTIDMLGLNDVHIAHRDVPRIGEGMPGHEKGDGAYVLSREPDYIQLGSSLGSESPVFLGDKEIARDPRFGSYVLETHLLPSGKTLRIYRRARTS